MGKNKTYYLVEIKKSFNHSLIEGYKIFKEKDFTKWLQDFNSLSDSELVIDNFSFPILINDFKITPINKESYKIFKTFDKLNYGLVEVFDTSNYNTDTLTNIEGERWECKVFNENDDIQYNFINSINDVLSNYYPAWEIPEEFLDKIVYVGRRYAILTLDEDIDLYKDNRFYNVYAIEKIKTNSDKWEYHIRLKSQQKPFYVKPEQIFLQ